MTKTLYDPTFEHDACGVGMVADLSATASNATILDALTILENLEHRGASGSDVDSGDGAGVLIQMPDAFLRDVFGGVVPAAGEYGVAHWMVPKDADVTALRAPHRRRTRSRRTDLTGMARRAGRLDGARTDLAGVRAEFRPTTHRDRSRESGTGPRTSAVLRAKGDRTHPRRLRVVVLAPRPDLQRNADRTPVAAVLL